MQSLWHTWAASRNRLCQEEPVTLMHFFLPALCLSVQVTLLLSQYKDHSRRGHHAAAAVTLSPLRTVRKKSKRQSKPSFCCVPPRTLCLAGCCQSSRKAAAGKGLSGQAEVHVWQTKGPATVRDTGQSTSLKGMGSLLSPVYSILVYLSEDKTSPFSNCHRTNCLHETRGLEALLRRGRFASCQADIAFTCIA